MSRMLYAVGVTERAGLLAPIPTMPWWGYALLVVLLIAAARYALPRIVRRR